MPPSRKAWCRSVRPAEIDALTYTPSSHCVNNDSFHKAAILWSPMGDTRGANKACAGTEHPASDSSQERLVRTAFREIHSLSPVSWDDRPGEVFLAF